MPAAAVAGVLVLFIVPTLIYAAGVPLGQPGDEPSHIGYARLIADHAALPGAGVHEKQQPPLYYLVAAGLLRLGVPAQGLRGLSVVLGAGMLLAVMATARVVRPESRWTPVAAGAAVALLPGVSAVSGAVSDDSLAWLVGAVLLLLACMVVRRPVPTPALVLAGACAIGVALIAKETDWPLVLVLAAAMVWRWRRDTTVRGIVAAVACPAAIAGWWFARNLATFSRPTPPLTPITTARQYLRSPGQLRGFASEAVRTLFGPESATGGALPRSSTGLALVAVGSAALGILAVSGIVSLVRAWPGLPADARRCVAVLASGCALVAVAWLTNSAVLDLQPQARYVLVAVAAPALAVGAQTASLLRHHPRATAAGAAALTAVLVAAGADALRVALHATPWLHASP